MKGTTQRKDFLYKLQGMKYCDYLKSTQERHEDTCQWFRGHREFESWRRESGGLLLVSAGAGCGKSVLAKYLIQELLPEEDKDAAICYFFFNGGIAKTRSFLSASKALLHGFLQSHIGSHPGLVDACMSRGDWPSNPDDFLKTDFETVWSAFAELSRNPSAKRTFCVIDAFDESDPAQREDFLKCLNEYNWTNSGTSGAKFIITTRGYPQILDIFKRFSSTRIYLDGDSDEEKHQIQNEISIVLQHRLDNLHANRPDIGKDSLNIIRKGLEREGSEQRTYLWMHLMFDYIEKFRHLNCEEWDKIFSDPPKTINEAYHNLLLSVTSEDKVRTLLALVLAAERPLTIQELNFAVNVRDLTLGKERIHNLTGVPESEQFKNWALEQCGSFVTFFDGKVYLVHQTAKEFLMRARDPRLKNWQGSMAEHVVHQYMAESCISLLSLDCFRGEDFIRSIRDSTAQRYFGFHELHLEPFMVYAAVNWLRHFKRCQKSIPGTNKVQDIGKKFVEPYQRLFSCKDNDSHTLRGDLDQAWYLLLLASKPTEIFRGKLVPDQNDDFRQDGIFRRVPVKSLNVARVACLFDHRRLLKFAFKKLKADVDPAVAGFVIDRHSNKDLALPHFAAFGGSRLCLRYLRRKKYAMDLQDFEGQTPLHQAVSGDHSQAIKTLLRFEVSTTTMDSASRTPFTLGMIFERCSSWITSHVKSFKSDDAKMRSLLFSAAMAEIPMETPTLANKSLKDVLEDLQSPHQLLTVFLDRSPIYFLCTIGANLMYEDDRGQTALHIAAQKASRVYNVICLIRIGRVKVDAVDHDNNTPLHTAAMAGNAYGAQALILEGADLNSKGERGNTSLHMACERGHHDVVKRLLEARADLEVRNDSNLTVRNLYRQLLCNLESEIQTSFTLKRKRRKELADGYQSQLDELEHRYKRRLMR